MVKAYRLLFAGYVFSKLYKLEKKRLNPSDGSAKGVNVLGLISGTKKKNFDYCLVMG